MRILYILTNEAFPDYVKIGKTSNLEKRLKQLYNTSIPYPFECFFACRVKNADEVEKSLHEAFTKYRVQKNREFFNILPEQVYAILKLLVIEDVTPTEIVLDQQESILEIKNSLEKSKQKRSAFNFKLAEIPLGSEIYFSRDESIKAKVVDNKNIELNEQLVSLSLAAQELLGHKHSVQGPAYWMYEGETLDERRKRLELEGAEE